MPGGINLKITVRETNLEHPAGHERPMPDVVDAKTSSLHQPVADSPLVLLEQNAAKLCQRLRADSVKRPDDLGSVVTEEARWLVSSRAVPRFHRDRRHPSSPGRGRDRSCDEHGEAPYPCHDRGTKTCSAGRDREGRREGNRWLDDSRARSFPGLRGGFDDPQEDHPDPRESLQNMDSLLQAGRDTRLSVFYPGDDGSGGGSGHSPSSASVTIRVT